MQPFSKTVMKQLLIFVCFLAICLRAVESTYRYNINDYLDDAVEKFNLKVQRAGDDYIELNDPVAVGGFVLTRPKLADMSTLERVMNAWLEPLPNAVEVIANFKFEKMHLDGWNLTGPGKSLEKPRISSRDNEVKVTFKGRIETTSSWPTANGPRVITKSCFTSYNATLTRLSYVVLVARDGVISLDNWTQGLFLQISEQLNPFLTALFEEHFDLCQALKDNGYKWSSNV